MEQIVDDEVDFTDECAPDKIKSAAIFEIILLGICNFEILLDFCAFYLLTLVISILIKNVQCVRQECTTAFLSATNYLWFSGLTLPSYFISLKL